MLKNKEANSIRSYAQESKVLLSGEECEVLIPLLAEGNCKIKDIQAVYDLIHKLQGCIEISKTKNINK